MKLPSLCLILTFATLAYARADDPRSKVSLVWTASDLAAQDENPLIVPAAGDYSVKVWAPAGDVWTIGQEGPALALNLAPKPVSEEKGPRWSFVGRLKLEGGKPYRIAIPESKMKPDEKPVARDQAPALIAISSDGSDGDLDLLRGNLTSTAPSADTRRTTVRTNRQGNDFKAPETTRAWLDRARDVREQSLVSLGLWPMFPKTPLHPRTVGKLERPGYTIEKVVIETLPGFFLAGNLYKPTEKPGKLPLMLCPHGHWEEGRVNVDVQRRCIRWAQLGCVVFLYDMVGYADSKSFGHAFLNNRLRLHGLSLPTLQTWNSVRAVDWLTSLPDVDPARIGCTGESGGGTQTFLLTAIDDRIKVAAPVVMVSDWFQGGCVCENCAGLRIGTDNIEFAALTAPRPLKLVGATGDWTAKTMTHAYPAIRSVYALTGNTDRISADVFDFGHNYNMTTRNAVYAFGAKWLLGIDDSNSTKEGELRVEDPADLYVFTDATPPPLNVKTAPQLETDLIQTLHAELDNLAPSTSPAAWEAARGFLKTALKVRVGLVNPPPAVIEETEVRRANLEQATIVHYQVGRKGVGDKVPVVRLIPKNATGRLTVIASSRGKAGLGDLAKGSLARSLLERGQSVVGFDPLFVGEAFDPVSRATRRPDTAHFETQNPTVAADQMQDLATVLAWARSRPDVREVSVVGGPQLLVARPVLEGLARTAVDLYEFDAAKGTKVLPPSMDLPGLLQFGGLESAAALVSPAPLWIFRTGSAFDQTWPENAYRLEGVSHVLRMAPDAPAPADLARWIDVGE